MSLNIAIVGAGAIGGYLGVKLALSGNNAAKTSKPFKPMA
jgi:ketopantoate reductase